MTRTLRVVIDATPLLGVRTGVGRYVDGLLGGLAALDAPPEVALAAFTRVRERPSLGAPWVGRRVPARVLHEAWGRMPFPPAEALVGRADVVHGTNFVLPPRRRAAGVVTVHDLAFLLQADTVTPVSQRLRGLVPRLLRSAEAVITPTQAVADQVAEHLDVDPARLHAVHHGLDPAWARTVEPPVGVPEHYVLFVGTSEPRKDLGTLVAALRLLGDDAPPLVVAGPAGWGPPVDLPARAVRLGFVDDEVLRSVVAGAGVLVLPSRDEGFGLPGLEALACGTPVVCSDLPALREVLGDQACYAPVGDAEAFATLLAGEPAGTAETRRARAAGFTWTACAQQTVRVYERACG